MHLLFVCLSLVAISYSSSIAFAAMEPIKTKIVYLTKKVKLQPALSNLDAPILDEGVQGVRLGIADNNGTGRFMKITYELEEKIVPFEGDVEAAFKEIVAAGNKFVVSNLKEDSLKRLMALPESKQVLLFNIGARENVFRSNLCRSNVFHTLPSRAMLADALVQFLIKKRWEKLFLITGPRKEDLAFSNAIKRSSHKFGAKIVAEKAWTGEHDARRTAQAEVPLFTQGVDYDVLVVSDEIGDFGDYLLYRTWEPKVVAGTQGLVPAAWHRTVEQWGAVQLQNRFNKLTKRWMTPKDYAGWAASRAIGEAVLRARKNDPKSVEDYLLSDKFQLAAFKGRKLTFRPWNGQMRQTIALAAPRSLVSTSPQEGFLHRVTDLDTLGYDAPEVKCGK
ncbi:MAG: ABC transporter substrate-binding protein [Rhodospirillales bacterium]|nr:ABC transporter substrate-binding protein [Rhodospirillales bacterium]